MKTDPELRVQGLRVLVDVLGIVEALKTEESAKSRVMRRLGGS